MTKEYWYFLGGMLAITIPLLLFVAVKKLHLLETRADQKIVFQVDGANELTLHAFWSKHRSKRTPAPALLLFHGGRWLYGGPEQLYPQCQFFSQQGYHCFSAQYRLGANGRPDVRGAIEDAREAFNYLVDHAAELHIDQDNIVVGGSSSGGHLAAALGSGLLETTTTASSNARRPMAQLLYNPMLDLAPGTPDHHLVKDYWQEVSPYHHIDGAVPPSLILVGSRDPEVPVPTAEAFCTALQAAGGHCELALYEGQGHGFFHGPKYRELTNQRILQFLANLKR